VSPGNRFTDRLIEKSLEEELARAREERGPADGPFITEGDFNLAMQRLNGVELPLIDPQAQEQARRRAIRMNVTELVFTVAMLTITGFALHIMPRALKMLPLWFFEAAGAVIFVQLCIELRRLTRTDPAPKAGAHYRDRG
jgi:hypothetical protein